jgi:hypothetical protein
MTRSSPPTPFSLEELQVALDEVRRRGFNISVGCYGNLQITVTLNKYATSGSPGFAMEVRAEGGTVREAFERAFKNFPDSPLDGVTKWAGNQLEVLPPSKE